jgi:hypothetical protein
MGDIVRSRKDQRGSVERDAGRVARVVATLGHHVDQFKSVKIVLHPVQSYPVAHEVAAFFQSAGWRTTLIDTPQEPFTGNFVEGVEVSGFNAPLVRSVGLALSEAGISAVRTSIGELAVRPDNPKYPYCFDSISIAIGHLNDRPASTSTRRPRRVLASVVVLISVVAAVLINLATGWKDNYPVWLALAAATAVWAAIEWMRETS